MLDLYSFLHLRRIVDIDLSYNRLEYIDERLFEKNRLLERLNLEGNKFMSISGSPLLKTPSLRVLNLKKSQLSFVLDTMFSKMPNLIELDLSQNLLNTLRLEDFQNLKYLKILRLSENPFKCDQVLKDTLQTLRNQGVQVVSDQCEDNVELIAPATLKVPVEKFQKMVMKDEVQIPEANLFKHWHLSLDSEEDLEDDEDIDEDNNEISETDDPSLATSEWLRFAPDAALCEAPKHKLCQSYRKCLVNLNTAWHEKRSLDSFVSSEAKFAFFLGSACGITSVICLLICALCVKNCCDGKKRGIFKIYIILKVVNIFFKYFKVTLSKPPTQRPAI